MPQPLSQELKMTFEEEGPLSETGGIVAVGDTVSCIPELVASVKFKKSPWLKSDKVGRETSILP